MIENLKPYPEYKESGLPWLGEVPAHWEIRPAAGVFSAIRERNTGMKENTVLSLSYGRIVVKPAERLHGLVPESFETYQIVNPGDIVIRTTDLQNDKTSLRTGFVRDRGIITSAYLALSTSAGVLPEFGYQFLNTWDISKAIYGYGSGLRQNLDFSDFRRMPVSVPPIAEQAAIARFLAWATNRLDRAIGAKRRIIALLQEQKQAIIHHAVTRGLDPSVPRKDSGIPWLGEIPEHWEVRQVRRVADFVTSGSRGWADYYSETGLIFIQSGNLGRDMALNFHYIQHVQPPSGAEGQRTRVKTDDLLICITGALTGNVVHVDTAPPGPSFVNQHVALVRASRQLVEPRFLAFTLRSGIGQSQLKMSEYGGTKQGLGLGEVKDVYFPLPTQEEQQEIVTYLDTTLATFSSTISSLEREITLLREYRTRLIADVVTGKLDVREMAAGLPEEELQDQPEVGASYDADEAGDEFETDLIDTAED